MKFKVLFILLGISLVVGLYQLPLVETTLNKNNVDLPINKSFPYSKKFQQLIEDYKLEEMTKIEDLKLFAEYDTLSTTITKTKVNIVNNKDSYLTMSKDLNTIKPLELKETELKKEIVEDNTHCVNNCKVLMIGDSIMGDLAYALKSSLRKTKKDWTVIDAHKVSSGLVNKNYYDWPETLTSLLETNKPDYVFVLIGTNDVQGIHDSNGKPIQFKNKVWKDVYGDQVKNMVSILNNYKTDWYWLELPVMKQESFNEKIQVIRDVQNEVTQNRYLKTEDVFGDTKSADNFDSKLRSKDGIHFNIAGANKLDLYLLDSKFNF